jgi:hypothetical protein
MIRKLCCMSYYRYLCTYDLYDTVRNVFDACRSITGASGKGMGPGNRELFGPCEMASSHYECHLGPKKVKISRAQPPPTCPSNGSASITNHYVQGRINHRCIGRLMYKSPRVTLTGCNGVLREVSGPIPPLQCG